MMVMFIVVVVVVVIRVWSCRVNSVVFWMTMFMWRWREEEEGLPLQRRGTEREEEEEEEGVMVTPFLWRPLWCCQYVYTTSLHGHNIMKIGG